MTTTALPTSPSTVRHRAIARTGRLSPRASFGLLASIVLFFLASSSAPTPLYQTYQARWGFSPITTTIVFGAYAVAVLLALLVVGSLSDHSGRRPVLLVAVAVQALTMLVFATAGGVGELLAARIVQGLATGAALGAVGAGLLDLDRVRGTIANAVGPMSGTAVGALGSALLVQFLPAPTHVVYLVLFVVFVAQFVGVVLMPEPSPTRPGALASLRPRFGVPADVRAPLIRTAPALIAAWALVGFYASVGPALVGRLVGSHAALLGGVTLFVMAATAALTVLVLRDLPARTMLRVGTAGLLVGVGGGLGAISAGSAGWFFVTAALTGAGFGAAFQGALRSVVPLAAPQERAGVLSILYVASYLAMGLPAVVAGFLVVHGGGIMTTAREYGLAVMVLAAAALIGTRQRRSSSR